MACRHRSGRWSGGGVFENTAAVFQGGLWSQRRFFSVYIYIFNKGTNILPEKSILKMIFLFPRWDMLISWRVYIYIY